MIELEERGRRLFVRVGGELDFEFAPITAREGTQLQQEYLSITSSALADDAGADLDARVEEQCRVVLGDHYDTIEDQLRAEEVSEVFTAVLLWQVNGGGFGLAKKVETDGAPKALAAWLETPLSALLTSLSTASGSPIR